MLLVLIKVLLPQTHLEYIAKFSFVMCITRTMTDYGALLCIVHYCSLALFISLFSSIHSLAVLVAGELK